MEDKEIDNTQQNVEIEPGILKPRPNHPLDPAHSFFGRTAVDGIKGKSVRGGAVAMIAQGLKFALQTGSSMALARLLAPNDYGLQGMVLAVTGFLGLFKDAGLSMATVQRDIITHEQTSTLFWINVGVGAILAILTVGMAPVLVLFYREPRLFWIAVVSASMFLLNGLAAQHQALLQRNMRFVTIAWIELLSLTFGSIVGIAMAALGCGYWALVGMAISGTFVSTAGSWLAIPWLPGTPSRKCGVRSMLHFGGTITCNGVVVYLAYNAEKILLGRFWGAEVLGLYGKAFQLVNLPMQQLGSSISSVVFPALSRIQDDFDRASRSFLRVYSIFLSLTIPITILCAIFSEEIVRILLGPRWMAAAPIFRLLSPAVLSFALINPFGWFLTATGRAFRSLKISFLIAPLMIFGIIIGLRQGPQGVAIAYSSVITLLVVPIIAWAKHGTLIKALDIWRNTRQPILSGCIAAATAVFLKYIIPLSLPLIPRLLLELSIVIAIYSWVLLIVMGQRDFYFDILKQLIRHPVPSDTPPPAKQVAS